MEIAPVKEKKAAPPQKPVALSPELAKFMGAPEATRPDVTKALWVYIKKHGLLDPVKKSLIRPDATLAVFIGKEPLNMMKMTAAMKDHFPKKS